MLKFKKLTSGTGSVHNDGRIVGSGWETGLVGFLSETNDLAVFHHVNLEDFCKLLTVEWPQGILNHNLAVDIRENGVNITIISELRKGRTNKYVRGLRHWACGVECFQIWVAILAR